MAISIRAVGAHVSGTSKLTPVIPTAQVTGDMMVCLYGTKPYSDAPTISQGWVSIGSATDGTVAAGVDVGSMQTRIFYKIATSDTETDPTITNSTNNVSIAVIIVFQKTGGGWQIPVGAGGGDATAGTGFSVTVSSDVGHTAGDMVVCASSFRSDGATPTTARTISITGCTMGTYVMGPTTDPETTSGGDMGMTCGYRPVNSGTSSAAPIITATLGAAHTGSAYAVRLRESVTTTVTPSAKNLILSLFIPVILLANNITVVPGKVDLIVSRYAPSATTETRVTPGVLAHTLTAYVPTVSIPSGATIIPGCATLNLTEYTPTLITTIIPGKVELGVISFEPNLKTVLYPGLHALSVGEFVPSCEIAVVVVPGVSYLISTKYSSMVVVGPILIPGTLVLGGGGVSGGSQAFVC